MSDDPCKDKARQAFSPLFCGQDLRAEEKGQGDVAEEARAPHEGTRDV
jgi:hypothetical protein